MTNIIIKFSNAAAIEATVDDANLAVLQDALQKGAELHTVNVLPQEDIHNNTTV